MLLLSATAQAASVSLDAGTVLIRASAGEANNVRVTAAGDRLLVTDSGAPPSAGDGCEAAEGGVSCPVAGAELLRIQLDDGDDTVSVGDTGLRVEVDAGAGDDTVDTSGAQEPTALTGGAGRDSLLGGGANDVLDGGEGNDVLAGGAGSDSILGGLGVDVLRGDAGNDLLTGGGGADAIAGGAGMDTVSYAERRVSVAVYLDGKPNDGTKKEHDRVATDVENAVAGSGNDLLYGSEGRNVLIGGGGNDTILGLEGADRLEGGDGRDALIGGPGNDRLRAGPGTDYCNVGPGGGVMRDCERSG
jgi:hypothetical protein